MLVSDVYLVLVAVNGLQARTVLQELNAKPEYSIFLGFLSNGTKISLDASDVSMTIFIPTNYAAHKFLDKNPIQADNLPILRNIAEQHIVKGNLDLALLKEKSSVATGEDGPKLWIAEMDGSIYINSARVTSSMVASNGAVHEIDAVIYPLGYAETLKQEIDFGEEYSGFKSLLANATEVGDLLHDATAKFTVFSPNPGSVSDAITAMNVTQLLPVIRRHLVRGQVIFLTMLLGQCNPLPTLEEGSTINVKTMDNKVFVGSGGYWSMVESVAVSTSNGVIYVINGVLGVTSGVNVYEALGLFDSNRSVTHQMVSFSTKLKKDLMNTTKTFTVFSPQNIAWYQMSTSEKTTMEKVLKRHVVIGKFTAELLMEKTEILTLSGEKVAVKKENGKVFLEFDNMKAEVTFTDNMASNGIIHDIDKVLSVTKLKPVPNHDVSLVLILGPLIGCLCFFIIVLVILCLFKQRMSHPYSRSCEPRLHTEETSGTPLKVMSE